MDEEEELQTITTIMFVELPENVEKMHVGYRLTKGSIENSPTGIIRIARFTDCFYPQKNRGYYGDIYLKRFVRKWKKYTAEKKQRIWALKGKIVYDTYRYAATRFI
jgi:hypothetical protein